MLIPEKEIKAQQSKLGPVLDEQNDKTNLLELELSGELSDGVEHVGPLLLELLLDVFDLALCRLVLTPQLL